MQRGAGGEFEFNRGSAVLIQPNVSSLDRGMHFFTSHMIFFFFPTPPRWRSLVDTKSTLIISCVFFFARRVFFFSIIIIIQGNAVVFAYVRAVQITISNTFPPPPPFVSVGDSGRGDW